VKYVWETELMPNRKGIWVGQLHLKLEWRGAGASVSDKERTYKTTVAWVDKIKDRKWDCQFTNHNGSKIFSTKKAAMAYAVAIITLEN